MLYLLGKFKKNNPCVVYSALLQPYGVPVWISLGWNIILISELAGDLYLILVRKWLLWKVRLGR